MCGLHPAIPSPPSGSLLQQQQQQQHVAALLAVLLSLPRGKPPSKFHPRSLMYAELYGRNSKFGTAVLGAFTMSFHPFSVPFHHPLLARSPPHGKGRGSPDKTCPPYKRRTRVILIRTRPRGAEVKASFLLGVSTKAPSASYIYTYASALQAWRYSRKRTLVHPPYFANISK